MKVCKKCLTEKDDSEFRIQKSKSNKNVNILLSARCKICESDTTKEHYNSKKNDTEFKLKNKERSRNYLKKNKDKVIDRRGREDYIIKHNEWAKERYHKNKDAINKKQKAKRDTQEYKAYVKAYRLKRKDIIFEQEKIAKKKYIDKHRDSVSDEYCIAKIKEQLKVNTEDITKEMIDIKRIQILIKRLKNTIVKTKKNI